jgi:hypothetical protein
METKMIVGGMSILVILMIAVPVINLSYHKWYDPQREEVHREVVENTPAFIRGKSQELSKMRYEYQKSDYVGKGAIAARIRHDFANIDKSKFTPELQSFLTECFNN